MSGDCGEDGRTLVWSCNICGPAFSSRGGWCDLGCGSDYNAMTRLYLDAFGVVLVLAWLWEKHERMPDIPWFWPPRGLDGRQFGSYRREGTGVETREHN